MNAPTFVLAGLMAIGLAADSHRPASAGPVLVLYVGAEDCTPCRAWRHDEKPAFLAGLDAGRVQYREIISPRLSEVFDEQVWPDDLRPYRSTAEQKRGVPLWLVVRGGQIVDIAAGTSQWRSRVLPQVRYGR